MEPFFSQEDFQSFTSQPSLLEYLQTCITSKDKQSNAERQMLQNIQSKATAKMYGFGKQNTSTGINELDVLKNISSIAKIKSGLEIEYPKLSSLSKENQETFLEEYEKAVKGVVLDETKKDTLKEMKPKIIFEQQEFQQFVYQYAKSNADKYNSIPPEAQNLPQVALLKEKRIKLLKQCYHLNQTLGLSVGAHFKSDPVLEFQEILLQVGDVPVLVEPTNRIKLSLDADSCKQVDNTNKVPLLLSEDPVIPHIAKEHSVNLVISSCCLQTLIDNEAPQFNQQWDIPVIVSETNQGVEAPKDKSVHKIVFMEKPLPKKVHTPNQLISKVYKRALVKKLCQTDHIRAKSFVYSLWKFGKFRLLIRSKLDAYKTDENTKVQTFLSVVAKPEFQWQFGYERLTPTETARWWLKSYIRPHTTVLCARIKRQNNEVLRVDEMTATDILSSGSAAFNPAKGMKLVYQIFNSLSQLSSDSYLLTHERCAIHCCLYKNAQHSTTKKKPDLDLSARYSKPITIVDFTSLDVPWSGIDTQLFLAEHIEERKIPGTFPAVSESVLKEIEQQKRKQMELMFPANVVKMPVKKKKKKKKKNARLR